MCIRDSLITVIPEEIQSPEMTADWETKLLQIERGEMEPETFMTEIKEMISSLVTTTEIYTLSLHDALPI